MTTLTLAKLAEIEAAAAQLGPHDRACDPATVAALCRVARCARAYMTGQSDYLDTTGMDLFNALRAAGLLE